LGLDHLLRGVGVLLGGRGRQRRSGSHQ
jgi:hypothetical protein